MLRYFTVITNLFVALLFTASALDNTAIASPRRLAGVTLAILLVGVLFHLLLRGMVQLSGGARLADTLNHSVTPLLCVLYWLVLAPKGHLRRSDPLIWSVYPLVYLIYGMVRGWLEGAYAYPFLDLGKLGWLEVLETSGVIAAGFVVTGFGMVWLDGWVAGQAGGE